MAMSDSTFNSYLAKILSARYGEEVRGSIHDSLQGMYEIVKGNVLDVTTAKQTIDTAAAAANSAAEKANTSATKADTAASNANTATSAANTAAGKANASAAGADTAKNAANTAASNATTEAGKATVAASQATSAATSATEAASSADDATKKATEAITKANEAATGADSAADRANTAAGIVEDLQVGDLDIGSIATKEYVGKQIDAVEIGGTNLFAVSKAVKKFVSNSGVWADNYEFLSIGSFELQSYVKNVTMQIWGDVKQLDSFGDGLYAFFAFYKEDGTFLRKNHISTREEGDGQYNKYTSSVPNDAKYVYFGGRVAAPKVENVRIKFEFGDKPTDWSPAPEDVDHEISRRTAVTYDYGGKNLKEVFGTAEALHNALAAEDYSQIAVGDYWPITLTGTFWDYGSYTVKSGVKYYSNNTLQAEAGTTAATYEGAYASNTAVSFVLSGSTYYVNTSDCLPYFVRTCNNVAVKLEVAGINHYWRYGDKGELSGNKPHIVFISRDCLPFNMRTRKSNDVWEDTQINNPWLGSALFKTFNDNEHGILKLLESTDVGEFIYAGPNNKGMRARIEKKGPNDISATTFIWLDRGKLFIPTISEVAGQPHFLNVSGNTNPWANSWANAPASQFEIFIGSFRHVAKGFGDGGSRTMIRLASTAQVDKVSFSHVDVNGNFGMSPAENILNATVLCFVFV